MLNHLLRAYALLAGFLAVLLGAVGRHALAAMPERKESYFIGVNYLLLHALLLLAYTLWYEHRPNRILRFAMLAIALGMLLFSGSVISSVLLDAKELNRAAPFGGTMLMLGWLLGGVAALVKAKPRD
jgi:uncharacterized membrane protein YgdD (TMEM256/DUF423 family)